MYKYIGIETKYCEIGTSKNKEKFYHIQSEKGQNIFESIDFPKERIEKQYNIEIK